MCAVQQNHNYSTFHFSDISFHDIALKIKKKKCSTNKDTVQFISDDKNEVMAAEMMTHKEELEATTTFILFFQRWCDLAAKKWQSIRQINNFQFLFNKKL